LERRVLSKDQFPTFASKVVPFLHLTTRIPGRKNDDLFHQKNRFGGFPTLAFMDEEGEIILTLHPSQRSLEGFEEAFAKASRYVDLRRNAGKDPKASKDFLFLRMEMKELSFSEAWAQAKTMRFTPEERLRFEKALVETLLRLPLDQAKMAFASLSLQEGPAARARAILQDLEIRKELLPLRRMRAGSKKKRPYGLAYGLFKKGKVPSGKPHFDSLFWTSVSEAAFQKKDVPVFEEALRRLREAFAKNNPKWVQGLENKLSQLKKELQKKQSKPQNESQSKSPTKDKTENRSKNNRGTRAAKPGQVR
jgi:hypothetical protein